MALFFALGKSAISIYLKTLAVTSAYGAAGFPIALLAWLYYSAFIILCGAEILSIMIERKSKTGKEFQWVSDEG